MIISSFFLLWLLLFWCLNKTLCVNKTCCFIQLDIIVHSCVRSKCSIWVRSQFYSNDVVVHLFDSWTGSSHGLGPRFCSQCSISNVSLTFSYSDSKLISSLVVFILVPISFRSSSNPWDTFRYLYLFENV